MSATLLRVTKEAHWLYADSHQMPSSVVLQARMRSAFAAASLVKHDYAVHCGVKEAAETGGRAAAWAAVHNSNGLAHGVPALLVVHRVHIGHLEHTRVVGVYVWIKL
jgi:hypothetical protein